MGCSYIFDKSLARNFYGRGRNSLIYSIIAYEHVCRALFKGRGGESSTDILMPTALQDDEDEIVDPCVPCFDKLSNHLLPINPRSTESTLFRMFRYSVHRNKRAGSTPFMFNVEEEAVMLDDEPSLKNTEYSKYVNFNHYGEENMDRIVPENNDATTDVRSFIPIDIGKSYLNEAVAYYKTLFGHLPNEYYAIDYSDFDKTLNFKKSMEDIEKSMDIKQRFVYKGSKDKESKIVIREVNYVIDGGILLFFSELFNAAIVIYDKPEQLDKLLPHIHATKNKKTPEKPKFKLLVHSQYGFGTEEFDLKSFDVNVKDNYNDDLPDKKIREFINSDGEAGLCILHGKPGTGKTYYIRDLIKNCKRDFIYMNKECLNYINDSSFIAFLIRSKNSVFIMEDCKNVLASRTEYNNTISTLLNLSDGLLGDSLNNKFICTFNTDISNVDEALLRKGRMKVCYEFKYLDKDKANRLAEKLDKKDRFDKDVPLCAVMNSESNGGEDIPSKRVSKIGF